MAGAKPRTSCRSLFKELEILFIPCQYTLSLINFIPLNNQEMFHITSSTYNINTRNKFNIHGTVHRSMTSSNNQQDAA